VINLVFEHQENILPFQQMNQDLKLNEMNVFLVSHLMFVEQILEHFVVDWFLR
jgi:hypothetical protein